MNKEKFSHIVSHPNKLSKETLKEVKEVVDNFPYCQTAHILLAKGQQQSGSMLANNSIKKAALYTVDRKNLKKFIESKAVELPEYIDLPELKDNPEVETTTLETPDHETLEEINTLATPVEDNPAIDTLNSESKDEDEKEVEAENTVDTPPSNIDIDKSSSTPSAAETFEEQLNNIPDTEENVDEELLSDVERNLRELQKAKEVANKLLEKPIEIIAKQQKLLEDKTSNTKEKEDTSKEDSPQKDKSEAPKSTSNKTSAPNKELKENKETPKKKPSNNKKKEVEKKDPKTNEKKKLGHETGKTKTYPKLNEVDERLGFDIFSSRYGEMLHEKEDTTSAHTREFHPDLFLIGADSPSQKTKENESISSVETAPKPKANTSDIIEKFIAAEPSITPIKEKKKALDPTEDLSAQSTQLKGVLITENMAKLYIKQENIKKAIEIYEALKLKYPEKKTYFADQISKIK